MFIIKIYYNYKIKENLSNKKIYTYLIFCRSILFLQNEERAALDQFTHSDRRVIESRITSGTSSLDRREQKFTQKNKVIEIENEDRFGQEDRSERIVDTDVKRTSDIKSETTESVNKHSNKMQNEKFERNVEIEKRGKEKLEKKMEERKTVRQSSVKSLTEKFIKNASKYFELF